MTMLLNSFAFGVAAGPATLVLHLEFEGTNGSTTIIDSSTYATTCTSVSGASIDTSQSKVGSSSLNVVPTVDHITADNSDRFHLGSGDFTMHGWFRWDSDPAIFHQLMGVWRSPQKAFQVFYNSLTNNLQFYMSIDGSASLVEISVTFTPTLATWYHIAVDFDGAKYRLYLDGVMIGSSTTLRTLHDTTGKFTVGADVAGANSFPGWADDVKLYKGEALWGSDSGFTP